MGFIPVEVTSVVIDQREASTYGQGKFISKDRYEIFDGVKMFFYDRESIESAFNKVGLFEITEINESQPFFLIKCKKEIIS
jgi:hypothetical protein